MLNKLSYTRKNKLLLPLVGLGILLCWFFALSKTVEAIQLNSELKRQTDLTSDLSYHPQHTQKKLDALRGILKSYRVSRTDWSNELWMKASAMAMKQQVGIDYTKAKPVAEKDTTAIGSVETLYCYGNFLQLIKLVDTLERTPAIGKISALQIKAPKEDAIGEHAGKCILKMDFRGLTE